MLPMEELSLRAAAKLEARDYAGAALEQPRMITEFLHLREFEPPTRLKAWNHPPTPSPTHLTARLMRQGNPPPPTDPPPPPNQPSRPRETQAR